jgi:hypothetical protein
MSRRGKIGWILIFSGGGMLTLFVVRLICFLVSSLHIRLAIATTAMTTETTTGSKE